MGDARADVGAQALRAVVADDEPELERAKAAAEGHVPGAGQRGLLRRGAFDHDFALRILLSAMFGKRRSNRSGCSGRSGDAADRCMPTVTRTMERCSGHYPQSLPSRNSLHPCSELVGLTGFHRSCRFHML